jgi:hypothetical protein
MITINKATSLKKIVAVMLTIALLFFYTLSPVMVYAQTVTPTPDPTTTALSPTPDPSAPTPPLSGADATPTPSAPDPSTMTSTTPTPASNGADATPTPDPLAAAVTPTPSAPDPSSGSTTTASNSASLGNTIDSSAITGNNALTASGSATINSSPTGSSSSSSSSGSTQTGDAASVVNAQNSVNSTSVNSNVIDQTINIYVTQNGNLNLSDPFAVASSAIQAHPNDPVINVSFTNINNYAYLSTTINSLANTGNNTANGSAITVGTGNAYSVVNLLNQVNFTVLNSQIHIVTINVFGTLNGNIILPNAVGSSTNCSGCGINILASNSGTLTNNINSTANTGGNTATGSATIQTGNANSVSNIVNLANTNFFGTNAQVLFINILGSWIGNFIGWGNIAGQQGGNNLTFFNFGPTTNGCSSCSGTTNIFNLASILNTINSTANSGNNSLTGNGSIITGNAFSAVSLINFINSNFINSNGFFGFINIFGNWTGDIGGLSNFLALNQGDQQQGNQDQVSSNSAQISSNNNSPQEQGGQLNIIQTNNVGTYVYPGDTVTFFIKLKNPGTGKVYGSKVALFLIYQGRNAGGTTFNIGDISANSGKTFTTGFVLSKNAPAGLYIARAVAIGNVGPSDSTVTSVSDSSFSIFGSRIITSAINQPPKTSVLGTTNKGFNNNFASRGSETMIYLTLIILLTFAYVSIRLVRKRKYIFEIISSPSFKEKLISVRMLLL